MKSPTSRVDIAGWWYELDQRVKIGLAVGLGVVVILLCILAILVARNLFPPGETTEPTAEATSAASVIPTELPPTWTPKPTEPPEPTEEPTPEPTQPAFLPDDQGDAVVYETGDPVDETPVGADIRVASIGTDLGVALESPEDVPEELAELATETDVLLWVELYEPIPEAPAQKLEWFFALDMDGDTATGRPAGQRPINPDLGYEVAIALTYDPATSAYSAYCLIWQAGSWVAGPQVNYYVSESGTSIGLAVSREALIAKVSEASGVTAAPDAVKGRVAALVGTGAERIADFYPELPE